MRSLITQPVYLICLFVMCHIKIQALGNGQIGKEFIKEGGKNNIKQPKPMAEIITIGLFLKLRRLI